MPGGRLTGGGGGVPQVVQVVQVQWSSEEPDRLLRVPARDLGRHQESFDGVLGSSPRVQRMISALVVEQFGTGRTVPSD